MVKFNLGEFLKVDTEDKYHPIVLSDTLVDGFFIATAGAHAYQAYTHMDKPAWVALHALSAALSAYWPYMIHKGYTHKGLGHASYGLAALVPHVTSLQVFGGLMVADKVINHNSLVLPTGKPLFSRTAPLSSYGTDNLFLDNMIKPTSLAGLSVNIPFIAATGALEYFGSPSSSLSLLHVGLGVHAALDTWKIGF